jgi:hypothetical protein
MIRHAKRARVTVGAVSALTVATLALSTSPASANGTYSGLAYVQGSGTFTDDWGDEGILSTSVNASSNATCLWQKILWADGKLIAADIDGVFGTNTVNATKVWQGAYGVPSDGVVGKATFGEADAHLEDSNGDGAVDTYHGSLYNISITRDSNNRYSFYDADGNTRLAGYNYRTCS